MKKINKLPKFKNYEEEAKFWDSHDFSELWEDAKLVNLEFIDDSKHEEIITLRVKPKLKEKLEQVAKNYGLNLSSLSRMWLIEKLQEATKKS